MTLEAFTQHMTQVASPRTALAYGRDSEEFEGFRAGRSLSLPLVEEWAAGLNRGRLNPQTIKRKEAALKAWLGFLGAHGDDGALRLAQTLRVYRVSRGPRQADRKRVEAVTAAEHEAAFVAAPLWGRHLMSLLWSTGCRISEVVGDAVSGIPALTVADGRALVQAGHVTTTGKGGRVRVLVLPSAGRAELAAWIAGRDPAESLFPSPAGRTKPVSKQGANSMLHRSGVLKGAHAFRHSVKERLRQAGVAEEIIRAVLGHGPRTVTDTYGRVSVREMLEAVEKLATLEEAKRS